MSWSSAPTPASASCSTPSTPRGVARVYDVSFEDRVLRLWRDGPDFAQRYHGRLSADGMTIAGAWEDGETWRHDFELTYNKVV